MLSKVTTLNVKKGQAVILTKVLSANNAFGNKHELAKDAKGYILNEGLWPAG